MPPFILYARQSKQLESDAYEIDGLSRKTAKQAKKAFNLLLNKESLKQPKEYDSNEWEHYLLAAAFAKGGGSEDNADIAEARSQAVGIIILYATDLVEAAQKHFESQAIDGKEIKNENLKTGVLAQKIKDARPMSGIL